MVQKKSREVSLVIPGTPANHLILIKKESLLFFMTLIQKIVYVPIAVAF
jgi:hypothetical protein